MKWTEIEIKNFAIPSQTVSTQKEIVEDELHPLELEQIRYITATNLIQYDSDQDQDYEELENKVLEKLRKVSNLEDLD